MTKRGSLGKHIRELRTGRGLTQRQLADLVGVDFSYLSKIENDRIEHTPSVPALVRLAEALETDELELMDLANKVPPAMTSIARTPEAMSFLRRAAREVEGPEGWRELSDFLDRRARKSSKRK